MRTVIAVSIVLGILWNVLAVCLMGGRLVDAFTPGWLLAGAISGVAAGWFAIASRLRLGGRESLSHGIANYYLAIVAYWGSFVVIERALMCIRHGGWTDFDLHDHLTLIGAFLIHGTVVYGLLLIPLCFLCRHMLWKIYDRRA